MTENHWHAASTRVHAGMRAAMAEDAPVFVISVAADLAGMHPQTLRQYDRLGLVTPSRTQGGGRRYSARDVSRLREVQRLSQEEGVSLPGIKRILDLESHVDTLEQRVLELSERLDETLAMLQNNRRVFAAGVSGDVVAMPAGTRPKASSGPGRQLVVWRPYRRHF